MRSDKDIVEQTNDIARLIYGHLGYEVNEYHKFYDFERKNYHPVERVCWESACDAQIIITATDPNDALSNIE